jgi:hypothetical protein
MSKGNYVAYAVLFLWPIFSIFFYRTKSIQRATLWTILGGFMVLPVSTVIDFPLIPPLGKHSIPVLSALIGIWFVKGERSFLKNNYGWVKGLLILFFLSPIITVLLNKDMINIGGKVLPGLTFHDILSTTVEQFLFIAPFLFGRQLFKTYEQQLLMFKMLVVAGLIYSIPILIEIRLSPQLHTWLYGYFPHDFRQQIRFGGYRPVVFMGHGLWVAFFVAVVSLSAIALWENGEKIRQLSSAKVSFYLLTLLVLCKSMASLLYGVYAFILIKHTSNKMKFRLSMVLVTLALLYPNMSLLKIFPHQQVANLAAMIDKDRASSLMFRFNQESELLDHGTQRFFFGWGGWGRNRVFDEETGEDTSVTDGRWIITFGQYGWLGFIAEFGLLFMSVCRAYKASKLVKDKKEANLLSAHAILVSLIMMEQLPNATLAPWLWLLAGILLGRSEDIISKHKLSLKETSHT